jgi:predicted dinucleotide-binding enzyme
MSYAIVGFGKIGQALAKAFARKGIEVSVATTRDPQSFASPAAAIGPTIIPKKTRGSVTEIQLSCSRAILAWVLRGRSLGLTVE